jgi:hypothetical protein
MQMVVFWVVAPCSILAARQRFRGTVLKRETVSLSETLAFSQNTTRRNNAENHHLQMTQVHILTTCFFQIHFNIVFSSSLISSKWSLPSGFELRRISGVNIELI